MISFDAFMQMLHDARVSQPKSSHCKRADFHACWAALGDASEELREQRAARAAHGSGEPVLLSNHGEITPPRRDGLSRAEVNPMLQTPATCPSVVHWLCGTGAQALYKPWIQSIPLPL